MNPSTHEVHDGVTRVARETGFSEDAVHAMLDALVAGGGTMAQFDHREFGGPGQWMRGGMLMTSDLFDHAMKARIEALCQALLPLVGIFESPGGPFQSQSQHSGTGRPARNEAWWPRELGRPDSTGTQNHSRYAYFSAPRRLVVDDGEHVAVYDTGDHDIRGVSQQQGAGGATLFTSQHGTVALDGLARIGGAPVTDEPQKARTATTGDPFTALEQLASLRERGIISDAEFAAKKSELLARI